MRGALFATLALAACAVEGSGRRTYPNWHPAPRIEGSGRWPTLEPDGRIGAVPIDPYAEPAPVAAPPERALHAVVDDHVPADIDFGDPSEVSKMVVRVKTSYALPSSPNHRVVVAPDHLQHVTIQTGPGTAVTSSERAAALRATTASDFTTPSVKKAAHDATAGIKTDRARVAALVDWVYNHITYVHTDEKVASVVLSKGVGDCSEMSMLFVALARASGVPARRVVGMAATHVDGNAAFGFHAWAEVELDGKWVPVDPTWDEPVADATHVVLLEGDGDEWSKALDGLEVGVVDLQHDKRLQGHADARQLTRELPTYLRLRH